MGAGTDFEDNSEVLVGVEELEGAAQGHPAKRHNVLFDLQHAVWTTRMMIYNVKDGHPNSFRFYGRATLTEVIELIKFPLISSIFLEGPTDMYITQQLKNQKERNRREKRVSSIISNQKLGSQQSLYSTIFEEAKEELVLKKRDGDLSPKPLALRRFNSDQIAQPEVRNFENFRLRKNMLAFPKRKKNMTEASLSKKASWKTHKKSSSNMPKLTPLNHKMSLEPWPSCNQQGSDLQLQNINRLSSFVRGAYVTELDEFSDFVNLGMVDRLKEDFYILNNLYRKTIDQNISCKMSIKDVHSQTFRDVVYLNEHKDQLDPADFKAITKKLKIVR